MISLLLTGATPAPVAGQPQPPQQMAVGVNPATSGPVLQTKKEPELAASDASIQVLDIASKNVDMSAALVSMAAYVLGALGIVLAVATLLIQIIGASSRKRAVDAAIKRTLDGLATNTEFAELVLQEIIQKQKLKDYIFGQIDQAVRERVDEIVNRKYFEKRVQELGIQWDKFNNRQPNNDDIHSANKRS